MNWNERDYNRPWHRWFAWYPVKIERRWYWLECVDRCIVSGEEIVFTMYGTLGSITKDAPADKEDVT